MPLLKFPGVRVKPWNDKEIRPGVRWDKEIKDALSKMDVFIPLISVNFAVSHYIGTVVAESRRSGMTTKRSKWCRCWLVIPERMNASG